MASFNFTSLSRDLAKANIDFDTAALKVLLVSSVPSGANQDAWDFRNDVTNEIAGVGYLLGGIAQAFTLDALGANAQTITYTNIVNGWTGATFSAVGAIIYRDSGAAATDNLLHFVDFGGTVSCSSGTFSITYSSPFTITA